MKKRNAKLGNFYLLAVLPEAQERGVRLATIGDALRKRGIRVNNSTVYSRIRTLISKRFVDWRKKGSFSRSYTKNPILYFLTPGGVAELNRLRECHHEEHGEYPSVMTLPGETDDAPAKAPVEMSPVADFLIKYKVPAG